jgi:hypothetical protein
LEKRNAPFRIFEDDISIIIATIHISDDFRRVVLEDSTRNMDSLIS